MNVKPIQAALGFLITLKETMKQYPAPAYHLHNAARQMVATGFQEVVVVMAVEDQATAQVEQVKLEETQYQAIAKRLKSLGVQVYTQITTILKQIQMTNHVNTVHLVL